MTDIFENRIGMGFDVHKFSDTDKSADNKIMLCGASVPHKYDLIGHSDADVGIHALVDAILGALAQGDIGSHFPPDDQTYKDAPSKIFLEKARQIVEENNGEIINVDITLICQKPKILPYQGEMRKCLADILHIDKSRVSVKATTTEGLGFTGRKEGIAAQAVTSIRVKL